MKNILKIQELEREIRRLQASSGNSRESAEFEALRESRRVIRDTIANLDRNAGVLAKNFEQITARYEQLQAKAEITAKHKPESAGEATIGTLVEDANYLTSELAKLEQKMRELSDRANRIVNEYNNAMLSHREMKARQDKIKAVLDQKQANAMPEIEQKQAQIKQLATKADKVLYEKYLGMRKDNIFPVFVPLRNNRCGGCQMEQSLHFMQKLKQAGMLPCEECRRIILAED